MPVPDVHPLHEIPLTTATATVASGQGVSIRAPITGRIMKIAAAPGVATGGGTATLTVTNATAATTVGVISIPISTAIDTSTAVNSACTEGDTISFAFTGAGTGGGTCQLAAYVRRIG